MKINEDLAGVGSIFVRVLVQNLCSVTVGFPHERVFGLAAEAEGFGGPSILSMICLGSTF